METSKQTEMVPGCQPVGLRFPGVPDGRQNWIVKVRFTWDGSKCQWCHYSEAITLGKEHLLHNDASKEKGLASLSKTAKVTMFYST